MLSLELSQLKEFVPEVSCFDIKSVPLQSFKSEINELKNHVSFLEKENNEIEGELHLSSYNPISICTESFIMNPGFHHRKKSMKSMKNTKISNLRSRLNSLVYVTDYEFHWMVLNLTSPMIVQYLAHVDHFFWLLLLFLLIICFTICPVKFCDLNI